MATRVALASRDGIVVHQHFGKATHFQIYDINNGAADFVEVRENTPSCSADGAESHERVLSLLNDCQAVVISRIGPGAMQTLRMHHMKYYVFYDTIEIALKQLIALDNLAESEKL